MTLFHERLHAQRNVYKFLLELCQPGTQLTKKELRHRVRYLLKHYAGNYDVIFRPDAINQREWELFHKVWKALMEPSVKILEDSSESSRKSKEAPSKSDAKRRKMLQEA